MGEMIDILIMSDGVIRSNIFLNIESSTAKIRILFLVINQYGQR